MTCSTASPFLASLPFPPPLRTAHSSMQTPWDALQPMQGELREQRSTYGWMMQRSRTLSRGVLLSHRLHLYTQALRPGSSYKVNWTEAHNDSSSHGTSVRHSSVRRTSVHRKLRVISMLHLPSSVSGAVPLCSAGSGYERRLSSIRPSSREGSRRGHTLVLSRLLPVIDKTDCFQDPACRS